MYSQLYGKILTFTPKLCNLLKDLHKNRKMGCFFVFHVNGKKIDEFYKSWRTAYTAIGKPGFIFHDLRRSAIRNIVRAAIPERVAMTISGHKTRSVFERYNVVSETDLKIASQKQEAYLQTQISTISSTVNQLDEKKEPAELANSLI